MSLTNSFQLAISCLEAVFPLGGGLHGFLLLVTNFIIGFEEVGVMNKRGLTICAAAEIDVSWLTSVVGL